MDVAAWLSLAGTVRGPLQWGTSGVLVGYP